MPETSALPRLTFPGLQAKKDAGERIVALTAYDYPVAELLDAAGVDILFLPEPAEMHPPGYKTYVEVHELQDRLCGRSRPEHFLGVATPRF
jgi:ketopantoate hydroxymethyltransferase